MVRLRGHFGLPLLVIDSEESPLKYLGHGTTNQIFYAGQTDSGVHVILREHNWESGKAGRSMNEKFSRGIRSLKDPDALDFCVGLYCQEEDGDGKDDWYALLVPDFTANSAHTPSFIERSKSQYGEQGEINGRVLYHDVPQIFTGHYKDGFFTFMADDAMIHIW